MSTFLLSYAIDIGAALLLLLGGWFVSAWAGRMVTRGLARTARVDQTLQPVFANVVRYGILGIAIVAALAKAGIQTTSILAVVGAAGLAIALALQNTLTNVASGVMLLFLRPFGVGDYVDCEGISGTVTEIGLFATEFETVDGLYVMVPNSQLLGRSIKNYSRLPYRRLDVKVGISYSDDIDKALAAGVAVLNADSRVMVGMTRQVAVEALGESSVNLVLRCWATRDDYWGLFYDLQKTIKERFDAEGISIPFPQRDVHLIENKSGDGTGASPSPASSANI